MSLGSPPPRPVSETQTSCRELAGVVFAFNTINRIADARRVQLECRFLRGLKPIRGWVERRLASLAGLVYDFHTSIRPVTRQQNYWIG